MLADTRHESAARAQIVRLLPGSMVLRHIDEGAYYLSRNRYHLVIDSPDGSPMRAGGESVTMVEGELWWFDNKAPHEAFNPGRSWRTHLIFDVEPEG